MTSAARRATVPAMLRNPVIFLLLLTLASCFSTEQMRSVKLSGFLQQVDQLHATEDGSVLGYRHPSADFRNYSKIMLEPVELWMSEETRSGITDYDAAWMAKLFNDKLRIALTPHFELVDQADPKTLRIRAALTDASESSVLLDAITTLIPQIRTLDRLQTLATGTHVFVGSAQGEIEILDAATNTRLLAGADRRMGGKVYRGLTDSWDDVDRIISHWTANLALHLASLKNTNRAGGVDMFGEVTLLPSSANTGG
jgi:hypothetical protein